MDNVLDGRIKEVAERIKIVFFNQKFIAKDKLLGYTVTAAGGKDHGKAGNQVNSE